MVEIVFKIFFIAFFLNLLWEVWHSQLYATCLKMELKKYIPLITGASLKDGFFITLFYYLTFFIFQNINIFENNLQLGLFVILALAFSYVDERASIKLKRWEYAPGMPIVFGVGITPLLELAVTGVIAFWVVFEVQGFSV